MLSQRKLLKELMMLSISLFYVMKYQIHQIKSNCLFVWDTWTKREISEDFFKFVNFKSGLTGKDLFKEIADTLNELGLDLKNFQGQGYDGTGAVSGVVNGLSALILKENEKAFYTHCVNHRLNLGISTSCKITSIRNVMNTIKEIAYFLKACVQYFWSDFCFSTNDSPSKTMKNVFYFV